MPKDNVVNLQAERLKRNFSKRTPIPDDMDLDLAERMVRIQASLEKINDIMRRLKNEESETNG